MDRMPLEILHLILLALSEVEDTREESAKSITDIKALRLSCRAFADLAPQYLFHDIWLYMEEDSFAKLEALTEHPRYGRMVRILKIFPEMLSADLLVKEDYEKCVKEITVTGDSRGKWGFGTDGRRDLSQEQLDAGFVEYNQIYEQQAQARNRAEKLLYHALTAFTRLLFITTGFAEEIMHFAVHYDPCNKIQDIARRTLMACRYDGWMFELYDPEDADMILRAIALSEREGLGLDLSNIFGTFDVTLVAIHSDSFAEVKKALVSLNFLALGLGAIDSEVLHEVINTGLLTKFLEYAANIQYLRVSHWLRATDLLNFETIFCTAHWSSLKDVSIHGLMVNADDLNRFMDRHCASLQCIGLSIMVLISGTWKRIFAGMQGRQGLKDVWIGNLMVGDADSEQNVLEIPMDNAMEDLLYAFIIGGKEWSPELPAGYSQEAKWYDA